MLGTSIKATRLFEATGEVQIVKRKAIRSDILDQDECGCTKDQSACRYISCVSGSKTSDI